MELHLSKQTTSMEKTLLNLDSDESDTDSVSLEESKELFPDKEDKKEEGASSEVENFDICEKYQEAFVG